MVALFLLGAFTGCVLNMLLDGLGRGSWSRARVCPGCDAPRPWWLYACELRPCPACGHRAWRAWGMVLGLGVATALLGLWPGPLGFWPTWGFLVYAVFDTVLDLEHRIVLPEVELAVGILAAVFGVLRRGWWPTLMGGLAGTVVMGGFYLLGKVLQKPLARRGYGQAEEPPLGLGDVFVSAVLGLFFGWPAIMGVLFLAVFAAGGFGLLVLLWAWGGNKQGSVYLPYAPFLFFGGWLTLWLAR